jgi:O-acetyl-ADP-ribose deacetylase (regulator of RNase III)
MARTANNARLTALVGDLTKMNVDVIVNAANEALLGGGGVDGAIHRAAGPELLIACRALNGCPTGEAKVTPGYKLPARWVIHTVGPVWRGGGAGEDTLLASCYRSVLDICVANGLKTVAFPAISTGVYGYPAELASDVAVSSVLAHRAACHALEQIDFVCFDDATFALYGALLG